MGACSSEPLAKEQVLYGEDYDSGSAPGWLFKINSDDNPLASPKVYWSVDDYRSASEPFSLYVGNPHEHSYDFGVADTTAISPPVMLPEAGPIHIKFVYYADLEEPGCQRDFVSVQLEVEGGEPIDVGKLCNSTQGDFWETSFDISEYAGHMVRVYLTFRTIDDMFNSGEGVYIDDFVITAGPTENCCIFDGDCDDEDLCTTDVCLEDYHCQFEATSGTYFAEDFEQGDIPQGWASDKWYLETTNPDLKWQVDDARSWNTPYSLYCGNSETHTYDYGAGTMSARTPAIWLPPGSLPVLRFRLWAHVAQEQCNEDFFEVRLTSGLWTDTLLYTQCDSTGGFELVELDLSSFAGKTVYIWFNFTVNSQANKAEGIYVDDIRVVDKEKDSCCHQDLDCDDGDICTEDHCWGTEEGGICFNNPLPGLDEDFDDGEADGWSNKSDNSFVTWQVDDYRWVSKPNSYYCGNVVERTYCLGQNQWKTYTIEA
ncbi:MAG: hypothetical protein ACTSVD_09705, partial [Candidatus Thorarchaeota archaeon]